MLLYTFNRIAVETGTFPPGTVILSMHDKISKPVELTPKQMVNVTEHKKIAVNDVTEQLGNCIVPNLEIATEIWNFFQKHMATAKVFILQTECSLGLSVAAAAVMIIAKGDPDAAKQTIRRGVHNPLMYKLMRAAAGYIPIPEPLVSILVNCNYPVDRLQAFILCMKRQRYTNWELVICTDGPRPDVIDYLKKENEDTRIWLMETEKELGHWGTHYRQRAIDGARGEYMGVNMVDNLLLPGYIEQLVNVLEDGYDLVLCDTTHSYMGFGYQTSQPLVNQCDLGCWLGRTSICQTIPWPGTMPESDGMYVQAIAEKVGPKKVEFVRRALHVHC